MAQQGMDRLTVRAAGTIAKGRGVTWDATQAGASAVIMGVADHAVTAGEDLRVIPIGCTADAEAGAAISGSERRLATDANGRFVPWTAGVVSARLVARNSGNTATALGQIVEVMPFPA
jgi:hypothetical protein